MTSGSLSVADAWPTACMHCSCATVEKPPALTAWTDVAVDLVRCHMAYTLTQNNGAHTEYERRKDFSTQGDKPMAV